MRITYLGPNDPRNSGIPNPRNFSSLDARGKEGAGTSHFDKNERGGERREGILHFPFRNSTGDPRSGVQRKGNSLLWSRARKAAPAGGGRRSFPEQSAEALRSRKKGNNKVPERQTLLGGPTGSGALHAQVKHACPRGRQSAVHTAPLIAPLETPASNLQRAVRSRRRPATSGHSALPNKRTFIGPSARKRNGLSRN